MKLIFGRLCDEHRKMKQQKLLSLIRQAIQDYNMIEDGDRIAVGVSGGKDSLTLLYAMKLLRNFTRRGSNYLRLPAT